MQYLEITIQTTSRGIDAVASALTAGGFSDLVLEDQAEFESFLDENRNYWDYIDEELQHQLEVLCPGICRYISLRPERFNQDLSPGMMLIEVGAAGNTLEEALAAAEILAQAIGSLAKGTVTADSTS